MAKHILITGGAGFIGSHLVDDLLQSGHDVTIVDNFDPFYAREVKERNIAAHRAAGRVRLHDLDILDLVGMRSALSGDYDAIVHIAARAGVRPSIQDPMGYQASNVLGTQHMLELAKEWGIKQFVFASSSSVYGVNPNVPWREDDHVLLPISPYASTKVSCELLGHVYSQLYGIRFLAMRFFTVYGPRQRPDLAIHKFAQLMAQGAPLPFFGDGSTARDYTYVADIVQGLRAAIDYDASMFEVINLSNNAVTTLHGLVGALEEALGFEARLDPLPAQPGDVPQTWGHIGKARSLLGYEPKTDLHSGLKLFARWFHQSLEDKPHAPSLRS